MAPSEPPDSLSRTLASWQVEPTRQPQFRAEVWARIHAAAVPPPWQVFARQHAGLVGGALALAVVAGGLLGHERARARAAAESAQLANAYVQRLDARSMRMP
ncbi:MAG: hypothetical protein EXS37_03355 [Opitutus sp.]|nr:hypothetical protein [Opitutus sp.]